MTIDFGAAFTDLFKTQQKWLTLLLLSVCVLIPVVGQMVVMGYLFRRYAGERAGIPAADFDFADFGEHLQAGLWPFLSGLVASLVAMPVLMLTMLPMFLGPLFAPDNGVVIVLGFAVGMILHLLVFAVMILFTTPIQLRSGLMMDFKAGFSKAFVFDFVRKVGLSYLLWMVLLSLILVPLALVGYLAFFVGVYVVVAWAQVVAMHLLFQHYDLYVARGGTPIPVNPALLKVPAKPMLPPLPLQGPPPTPPAA
jgi:hypothetical protein